jgi:transcriptional repressor NrdR
MVRCPFCQSETKVVDTRESEHSVRRRRECEKCEKRFTTYERPEITVMVVKKDGRREAYSREKLMKGIMIACGKRPIPMETIDAAVNRIENSLREESEVTSREIGEMVMKALKKIDEIAYIRFASVYRQYDDIKTLEKEIKLLRR